MHFGRSAAPSPRISSEPSKTTQRATGQNADDVEHVALTAMRSAPFDPSERGRIAVKIVTATRMEMTSVREIA